MDALPQDNNKGIHDFTSLLNTKIVIEESDKIMRSLTQYHNCQEYGPTKNYYHHDSRYIKRGENHHMDECTKD